MTDQDPQLHSEGDPPRPAEAGQSTTEQGLRAVNRAIGELRRGVPVIMHGTTTIVALPVETATNTTFGEFRAASTGPSIVLLAPGRARAMPGSATFADHKAAGFRVPDGAGVEAIRSLADPADDDPGVLNSGLPSKEAFSRLRELPFEASLADAALSLAKLCRLLPAVLVADAGDGFQEADLLSVLASDVLAYSPASASGLVRAAEAKVPLDEAPDTRVVAFRPPDGGIEHLAIVIGHPENAAAPLVRVHSECFTGDLLGSQRCDCGPQLHQAIWLMAQEGAGVVLYMAQEGRGIGLVNKLRAYMLQDQGLDTIDANMALGFEADERSFDAASVMLKSLGLRHIRLLTNNPDKVASLKAAGIDVVGRVSHAIAANGVNDFYLDTKARRFGHLLG